MDGRGRDLTMSDIAFLEATEQARLIREKRLSPVELLDHYIDRIERYEERLNSFVTIADGALEEARRAEAQVAHDDELPPFHGVPISIKDLHETKGLRTTFSCRALAEFVPEEDDNVVAKIRAAGFIIVGKSNTSEFGTVPVTESTLNGECANPWNLERSPGGSSGGAAAQVAAGLVPVAHAADGGGSVRTPAACCGLFGIKPARGRISPGPRFGEHWHGFSTSGPIGRSVRDTAALLDVMQGYMPGDLYWAPPPERPFADEVGSDPGSLRIAFTLTNPNEIAPDPEMRVAVEHAAKLLESLGHDVEEADPPWVDPALAPAFVQLISTGTAVVDFLPHEQLEPLNRFLVESAADVSSVQHIQALTLAHQFTRRIVPFWDDYDVLLTPTNGKAPVPLGWVFSDDDPMMALVRSGHFIPYTPAFNVTGQPAVSVPLHWDADGLPIGVQLAGSPAGEAELVRLAAQLEEAQPWKDRVPPLFP